MSKLRPQQISSVNTASQLNSTAQSSIAAIAAPGMLAKNNSTSNMKYHSGFLPLVSDTKEKQIESIVD